MRPAEATLRRAVANRDQALLALQKLEAEDSLLGFIRLLWPVLEPTRPLVLGWPLEAICEHLEAVARGEITRLVLNVPPGFMKSLSAVFLTAWEWGPRNRPDTRYLTASYSEALTVRDNRRCRMLVQSRPYRDFWGDRYEIASDQSAKIRFDTDKTGFRIASSVGGVGVGERADRVIIDDPHNIKDVESDAKRDATLLWFTEIVPTRLNDAEKSAIIVIGQRTHERDVSGHIYASELGFERLVIPMEWEQDHPFLSRSVLGWKDPRRRAGQLAWPARFPRRYLEKTLKPIFRSWGGTYAEAGQLQQRPSPRGGAMFRRDDLQIVPERPDRAVRVRGWDLAASTKGRYTVGCLLAVTREGRIYVEDVVRVQKMPGQVEDLLDRTSTADGPTVEQSIPQDPGQAGKAQRAALSRKLHGRRTHFSAETGSKEVRAAPLAEQAASGNVFLVRAPWNEDFVRELASFPKGAYDDQVDAASRAYARIIMKRRDTAGGWPQGAR